MGLRLPGEVLIFLLLVGFAGNVKAETVSDTNSPFVFDFSPLLDSVKNLPNGIANAFLDSFSGLFVSFITPLLEIAKTLITYNVDVNNYASYWRIIVNVISAFYLIVLMVVGFKFLLGSYFPEQR